MAHVTVNGIELHFDRVGEGPPLLLLHGLGSSASVPNAALEEALS